MNKSTLILDIGGTYIKISLFHNNKQISYLKKIETPIEIFLPTLSKIISELVIEFKEQIEKIAICFPGNVNRFTKTVFSNSLKLNSCIIDNQTLKVNLPLFIMSDALANTIGEWLSLTKKPKRLFSYVIGTGVGLGSITIKKNVIIEKTISSHGGNYQKLIKCCNNNYCIEPVLAYKSLANLLNINPNDLYKKIKNAKQDIMFYNKIFDLSIKPLVKHIRDKCEYGSRIHIGGGFGGCLIVFEDEMNKILKKEYCIKVSKLGNKANTIGLGFFSNQDLFDYSM